MNVFYIQMICSVERSCCGIFGVVSDIVLYVFFRNYRKYYKQSFIFYFYVIFFFLIV